MESVSVVTDCACTFWEQAKTKTANIRENLMRRMYSLAPESKVRPSQPVSIASEATDSPLHQPDQRLDGMLNKGRILCIQVQGLDLD